MIEYEDMLVHTRERYFIQQVKSKHEVKEKLTFQLKFVEQKSFEKNYSIIILSPSLKHIRNLILLQKVWVSLALPPQGHTLEPWASYKNIYSENHITFWWIVV